MEKKKENKLEHPCFPQPSNLNIKVWRYLDTSKLIDMLSRKSIFLCRIDLLGDAYEGSITRVNFAARKTALAEQGLTDIIPFMSENTKRANKSLFVNCWYYDDHESEAMWKLYCPDNKGVAIQTTYKKLVQSVNYDDQVYIGLIKYIDYETEWFPANNIYYPCMHKRKAFQFEKEIRLVKSDPKYWSQNSETPPTGIYSPWHMQGFAENIYVNPYAQQWYYEVIKDVMEKYGCEISLKWSTIKGDPYY